MRKLFTIVVLGFVWASVGATPFLTADSQCYDINAENVTCPLGYEYSSDTGATWSPLDADIVAEAITIWSDLAGTPSGLNSWLVRGHNAWGVSDSVPFEFTNGVPAPPSGLRVVAPPPAE